FVPGASRSGLSTRRGAASSSRPLAPRTGGRERRLSRVQTKWCYLCFGILPGEFRGSANVGRRPRNLPHYASRRAHRDVACPRCSRQLHRSSRGAPMIIPEDPPSFIVRTEAQKAAWDNGYRLELGAEAGWLHYASTTAPGYVWIAGCSTH